MQARRRGSAARTGADFRAAAAHLQTVRDLVRFAVSRFNEAGLAFGHGSDNALDEAAYLVRHALHLPADPPLEPFLDARLTPAEIRTVLDLLRRRVQERRPAAYLTREAWIGPHRFYVDERAIVPRSYIGHWLDSDISPWIEQPDAVTRVLELCTGSGCLAILLALALPRAHIDAVDISAAALAVARRNVADYGLGERIRLLQGDLYAAVEGRRYDLIAANPPYVSAAGMDALPAEYRHEPTLALAGGEDGLAPARRILACARRHLTPGGLLIMEVGHARPQVEAAFARTAFTWLETGGADDAVFLLQRDQIPVARGGTDTGRRPRHAPAAANRGGR